MLLFQGRIRTDSVTRTAKDGHTDMLKLIRYDPGRFTGRTTSETLYSTLDTALDVSSSNPGGLSGREDVAQASPSATSVLLDKHTKATPAPVFFPNGELFSRPVVMRDDWRRYS